ncbi:MAG TPA: ABC transporter substrate-binding protein [Pyrinomonadaceae bacterium]|jgi:branched-chain amino acid transport system substrate-binding protein
MRYIFLTVGLIIVLMAALACERRGSGGNQRASDTGAILIGYYGDMSGRTSNFGQSTKNGAVMAVDELNRAGGIGGRQIQLLVEDDQGRPEQAATVVTKFINQDRVHALLGEVASGNTLAAAPKAQAARIPMVTPSSTADSVTEVGDYIFRVCYTDSFQGEAMAKFAANTLKARRAAILLDFNSPYSRGLTQVFKDNFTKLGGEVVTEQSYTQGDRDYKGQLTTIRPFNPDVIFIPGYYGEVGVIAKQAKELGITQPLLGTDGWDAPQLFELGGAALNGSYMSNHYSVDDPAPAIQKFVAAYKAYYGGAAPDALAALGYDAMNVLADAIRRAGTTDGPKLREAIAQTTNFAGVTGTISINAQRNAIKPIVVLRLENGRYVYQETIQPQANAGGTAAL